MTKVRIGNRACGAVSIMLMSRMPASAMCRVRGIGVALIVRTSTSVRSCLRNSFWRTPKRCSSSMTTRPEILEPDVVLHQPVRADDDVDAPVCEALNHLPLLGFVAQAREHLDPHRERREPLLKRGEVLEGQDGRRHENGDLPAVVDGLEGGPQRDLGLAESDVADNQPIHRLGRLEVSLDRRDGRCLVGRFGVRE